MSDPRVEGSRHDDDGNYVSDRQKKKEKKGHRFQCFNFPKRRKNNSDDGRNSSKFSGRGRGSPDAFGCFSCLRRKQSSESIIEPQTSDPNSSEFTHEMLRDLIEKNDFYSKECNPYVFD